MHDRNLKIGLDPKLWQIVEIAEIAEFELQTNIENSKIQIKISEIAKIKQNKSKLFIIQ